MMTATRINQPLPVQPVEPVVANIRSMLARQQFDDADRGCFFPRPTPTLPETVDLVDAIRNAAFQQLLERETVR